MSDTDDDLTSAAADVLFGADDDEFYRRDEAVPTYQDITINEHLHLKIRLPGEHSLWAHHLWNASKHMASLLDARPEITRAKRVLELGAGGALPSLVCLLRTEPQTVVITDYPDKQLIDNITHNLHQQNIFLAPKPEKKINSPENNSPQVHVCGYLWGNDPAELFINSRGINAGGAVERFDVVLMCDLIFNHSMHNRLLDTCEKCCHTDSDIYVVFSHHRPWRAHDDMRFFELARERLFRVEKLEEARYPVMFEEDPGDRLVRETVHVYKMKLPLPDAGTPAAPVAPADAPDTDAAASAAPADAPVAPATDAAGADGALVRDEQ